MAQYPIDIKIDTGSADRELKSVNDQLDQTEKATTSAAKGANKLSTDTQQLIKSLQSLSKQEQQAASATRMLTDASKTLVNTQNQSITSTNRLKQAQDASSAQLKANTQALISLKSSIDQTNASLAKFNSTQNKTNESTQKTKGALDTLVTGAKAFVGLQVAGTAYEWGKAFVDTATKVELLQSRISLYTATSVESQQIFAQLIQQANRAGTDIDAAANSFQRFAAAGKDAGISNQVILQFTDNLQKMARVSGASSAEASAAIYQLSQAFASGRLQGDEFRSVSEQLPTVLQVLAKQMGVTTGELKQLGSDGEITRDKLLLLNNATDDINAQFARMPRTVDQSATALRNNLTVAIAELDKQIGASKFLAKFLDLLAGGVSGATELIKAAADTDKLAQATNELNSVTAKREANLKEIAALEQQIQRGYTTQTVGGYTKFVNDTGAAQKKLNELKKIDLQLTKQQASAQRGVVQATPLGKGVAENLATQASQFQASITAAQAAGRPDAESAKQIKNLKEQVTYTKALADGNYELAASQKLGNKATKEQIADYAALLKQQNDFKQSQKDQKKSASDEASAAKRAQKELERNQAANEKYLKTLQDKVNAGQFDVELAREQVQLNLTQGVSVEQLTASYQKSYLVQQQLLLQSQQAEAQSRLNKDATDAERAAVDAQVAALQKQQQQAKQLASQVGSISQTNQQTFNPVAAGLQNSIKQTSDAIVTLNNAQQAGILVGGNYNKAVLETNQAGMVELVNQLQAGSTSFTDFSVKMGSAAIGLAQFKVSAGDASFLDGFTASLDGLMNGYQGFANGATDVFANFFSSFTDGFADSIGRAIVYSENLGDALNNVAQQALSGLISGFVKLGIQYATNAALAATFGSAITATTAGLAATTAAAWAPAAALASLASFGANSVPAAAALVNTTALASGLALVPGFANGGLVTGPGTGQSDSINARLSNGEFVSTKQATSRYRTTLEAMNRGTYTPGAEGGSAPNVQVHNYGGERVQVKQGLTRDDVILIIGEEFPNQSASQWNDPYSQTNKAFKSNYEVNRKI